MPFSSSAPNFFGRFGAQTSPTNFGSPMDVFSKADATRAAMPNLFTTIQQVRQNELERQAKQATIAKVLQDLAIQQQLAPIEQQLKQAQSDLYRGQADMYSRIGKGNNQVQVDENGDLIVESYRTDRYGNLVPNRVVSKEAEASKAKRKALAKDAEAAQKEQNMFAAASQLIGTLKGEFDKAITPTVSVPQGTPILEAAATKAGGAAKRKLASVSGSDVALSTYNRGREGFVSQLKQLTQDNGVLTNQDIGRIRNILPSDASTKEEAAAAWALIDQIIKNGYDNAARRRRGESPSLTASESAFDVLRADAISSIANGAPEDKVKERFKKLTGVDL